MNGSSGILIEAENFEITGNFETDYNKACRKVGIKALTCLRFGHPLPPLPRDEEALSQSLSESFLSVVSGGQRKSETNIIIEEDGVVISNNDEVRNSQHIAASNQSIKAYFPARRMLSDRREMSIHEFLKKAQVDVESGNLFPSSNWISNHKPYYSRFRFTPVLDLEHLEVEEGESEILYKMELRNYKIPLQHLEIINKLNPSMPNVVNLSFWNCGLNESCFSTLASIISSGSIQQVSIDRNPDILESSYAQLLGDDSSIRILSLRGNEIGDNGAKLIGAALKTNRTLVSLDLFDNSIKRLGAEGIAEGLKTNSTLQSISLGKNEIGDEGIAFIAKALMNIPLSNEEVHQRKKLISIEMEKNKEVAPVEEVNDPKKKGGPKRAPSGNILKGGAADKDKKKAAAPKKGVEPVPPKGNKTPDDPKTKKILAAVDDKKGAKKPAAPTSTKGKKGKDEKDDTEEASDPASTIEPMFEYNNQWYILGNRTLNNINLCLNGITDVGVKSIFDALAEQEHTAENAPEGLIGLFRMNLRYNPISNDNVYYPRLVDLLISRNPFHEPTEDSELSDEFDEAYDDADGVEVRSFQDCSSLKREFTAHLDTIFKSPNYIINAIDMFQICYDWCNHPSRSLTPLQLLNIILDFTIEHCKQDLQVMLTSDSFPKTYLTLWNQFNSKSLQLQYGCSYLNTQLLKTTAEYNLRNEREKPVLDLHSHLLLVWQVEILNAIKKNHADRLVKDLLLEIRKARNGEEPSLIDSDQIIHHCIESFVDVNHFAEDPLLVYEEEVLEAYILELEEYYRKESQDFLQSHSEREFIEHGMTRLHQEVKRNQLFLHPSSYSRVILSFEKVHIKEHLPVLSSFLCKMIDSESIDDCLAAYTMVKRIPQALDASIEHFKGHTIKKASIVAKSIHNFDQRGQSVFIDSLAKSRELLIEFSNLAFPRDSSFEAALDQGFKSVFRDQKLVPNFHYSEHFAKYCDIKLKKMASKSTVEEEENAEKQLTDLVILLRYVEDRDVFQKFYARFLAKRLIHSTSKSLQMEQDVVFQLRELCGFDYTLKFQKMITDIELSHELDTEFKKTKRVHFEFKVLVLTTGAWPLPANAIVDFVIPKEIDNAMQKFTQFYLHEQARTGRKLIWNYNFFRGEVRVSYLDKPYEISLGLIQLVILLLYNNATTYTVNDVQVITGISLKDIEATMKGFLDLQILTQNSASSYELNMKFESKRIKVKMPNLITGDGKEEQTLIKMAVDEERIFYLQAVIVRLMKLHKTLSHTGLLEEVIKTTSKRFQPSISSIKKCIEALIEKEYLERSKTAKNHYSYIQ